MKRLDQALVEAGLAPTRSKAQQMIEAGEVEVFIREQWQPATQNSQPIENKDHVRVRDNPATLKFVSRGGLKLEGALKRVNFEVHGIRCLDLGISTGGFTDCLLQQGASSVLGIDVGHGQLHEKLRQESRLKSVEGLHVRDITANSEAVEWLAGGVGLCVADLSFISLISVLPELALCLPRGTHFLGLVKPQFEVGAANLDKKGIVRDPALYSDVRLKVLGALEDHGFRALEYFASDLKGQDGNQEFFVFAVRS